MCGHSGVGKSSVVNELPRCSCRLAGCSHRGSSINTSDKRDIPYAALAEAFQSLIRRLLGKSEGELAPWRNALRQALGPGGRFMIDLVPELRHIIGDQPPVPDLLRNYELVNQLNRGAAFITSDQEREQLAELNLIAGRRENCNV